MDKEYKYFVIEIIFGAFMGMFFLHPLSMFLTGGIEALVYYFKGNINHLLFSHVALYFTLVGVVMATGIALSRIKVRKKNILLERQKKEIEEAKEMLVQLNATKDKLFTIISHDLKNPMNSIFGFSEILIEELPKLRDEEIIDHLKIINSVSKQTCDLLDNLLVWSRSQTNDIEFRPSEIYLKNLLPDCISLVNGQASYKKVEIEILPINHNGIVLGDLQMIKTILRNLLTNAIKFSKPDSKVRIAVNERDIYYEITVSDSGIGIDKNKIDRLFEIATNTTTSGTSLEPGTGFGLIICKEFVEKNGGKIWCESEVNIGSKFKFTLPKVNSINGLLQKN